MPTIRFVRSCVLLCLAGLMASCAKDPFINTDITATQDIPSGFGVVAVQVISNTRQLGPSLTQWTNINVVDIDHPELRYRVPSYDIGMASSQAFIGALPAGRYAIFNLHAFENNGDIVSWINAPVPRAVGTFVVAEDGITTLGTLAYQPLEKVGSDNAPGYFVTRIEDQQDLAELVVERHPSVAARIQTQGIRGWEESPADETLRRYANRLRELVLGSEPQSEAGVLVIPSRLGQIRWREPGQEWQRSDTGYTNEILTVSRVGDAWIAGGERGLVLVAPELAGPWKRLPGPSPREAVYWTGADGKGGFYALAREQTQVNLYRQTPGGADWQPMKRFPVERYADLRRVSALVDGDRLRVFAAEQLWQWNGSEPWTSVESSAVSQVTAQLDGSLIGWAESIMIGRGPAVSPDQGRTWERLVRPVRFGDAQSSLPYRAADGRFLIPGAIETRDTQLRLRKSKEVYLLASSHRARDWRWLGQFSSGCEQLAPAISSSEHLYAICRDGSLERSDDGGKTWQRELDTGLDRFDAPGMQPERSAPITEV
jgi:hypothetical protein